MVSVLKPLATPLPSARPKFLGDGRSKHKCSAPGSTRPLRDSGKLDAGLALRRSASPKSCLRCSRRIKTGHVRRHPRRPGPTAGFFDRLWQETGWREVLQQLLADAFRVPRRTTPHFSTFCTALVRRQRAPPTAGSTIRPLTVLTICNYHLLPRHGLARRGKRAEQQKAHQARAALKQGSGGRATVRTTDGDLFTDLESGLFRHHLALLRGRGRRGAGSPWHQQGPSA